MKNGIELIAQERQEQIEKHGYSKERDKRYTGGQLLQAAQFCLVPKRSNSDWPQDWSTSPKYKIFDKSRIGQLACAGAFYMAENDRIGEEKYNDKINEIAAEIDRLQSIEQQNP